MPILKCQQHNKEIYENKTKQNPKKFEWLTQRRINYIVCILWIRKDLHCMQGRRRPVLDKVNPICVCVWGGVNKRVCILEANQTALYFLWNIIHAFTLRVSAFSTEDSWVRPEVQTVQSDLLFVLKSYSPHSTYRYNFLHVIYIYIYIYIYEGSRKKHNPNRWIYYEVKTTLTFRFH